MELDSIIEGEEITIKGYLLKRADGLVLSSVPAIKSCCPLRGATLKVAGDFSFSPYQVVKLKGVVRGGTLEDATSEK